MWCVPSLDVIKINCVASMIPNSSNGGLENVLESYRSTGRNLLQAKTNCPVSFEFLNYTIITSQCKGPQYLPKLCCGAFKELACPYATELNDLTNDCASTMFSYINLYGKYPPGLFSSECQDTKEGLTCNLAPPPAENVKANGAWNWKTVSLHFPVLVTGISLVVLLVQML
ncbi:GPI-anchored protein LLG1-like [Telopea speciosissima]|uniref:GPI-anchored protein LLG1-like n=1 Tax=Telopea speciosissima TaxID=54955 RepID=UPI001CC45F4F|nr:GPI-anchored protein LLG1-like [Telopea speciosissima]